MTDEVGTATDLLPHSDRIKTHRLIRSLPFPAASVRGASLIRHLTAASQPADVEAVRKPRR
ncbi:hypothetical protein GAY28_17020 [Azospirillum brasilense]|nr:hypothetical protein [Azospirillum brasilense]